MKKDHEGGTDEMILTLASTLNTFAQSPSWGIEIVDLAKSILRKNGVEDAQIKVRFRDFDRMKHPISNAQYMRLQKTYQQ